MDRKEFIGVTTTLEDGRVEQTVDGLITRVMDIAGEHKEAAVRAALMQLGWIPPEQAEEWRRDAERFRWLRDNTNVSLYLTRNDHASVYRTAEQTIRDAAERDDDSFEDNTPEEVQKMKDTNTIWSLQIYPNTPIGFNLWHAATLDAAIDAARKEGV